MNDEELIAIGERAEQIFRESTRQMMSLLLSAAAFRYSLKSM